MGYLGHKSLVRKTYDGPVASEELGMTRIEDQVLVRVGRGDAAAIAALYDDVAGVVYGLVLSVVGDPAQAEPVAREVFLEVWHTAAHFDPARASATGWIMGIAHRHAVEHLRSTGAPPTCERGHTPATRHALGSLSTPEQQALGLAYFGGRTHRDVATTMQVAPDVTASHLVSGLVALRRWLDPTRAKAPV